MSIENLAVWCITLVFIGVFVKCVVFSLFHRFFFEEAHDEEKYDQTTASIA